MLQKSILHRINDTKYYVFIINESIDISIISHLVVFATFIEYDQICCVFLSLLDIKDGKKDVVLFLKFY